MSPKYVTLIEEMRQWGNNNFSAAWILFSWRQFLYTGTPAGDRLSLQRHIKESTTSPRLSRDYLLRCLKLLPILAFTKDGNICSYTILSQNNLAGSRECPPFTLWDCARWSWFGRASSMLRLFPPGASPLVRGPVRVLVRNGAVQPLNTRKRQVTFI